VSEVDGNVCEGGRGAGTGVRGGGEGRRWLDTVWCECGEFGTGIGMC